MSAKRGSAKRRSVEQEEYVARKYGGVRSKSSGAAAHDYGDVRTPHGTHSPGQLIECKVTTGSRVPQFIQELEKIAREAWVEGREPVLVLRYEGCRGNLLADVDGNIDIAVRRMLDDVERGRHEQQDN